MPTVYLGLGSNLGDRLDNLRRGVELLRHCVSVTVISSVYETDPVGVEDQGAFFNLVLSGHTNLSPRDLLHCVKRVERDAGRRPTYRWGPRELDIDILLYGDATYEDADLTIPHKELPRRAFVLVPLLESAPDLRLPDGSEVRDCLARLGEWRRVVRFVGPLDSRVGARESGLTSMT